MATYTPIASLYDKAIQAGLSEGMDAILERSNELAPEFEGELINSGETRVDDLTGQVSYKSIGYPYVVDQHENLELKHPRGGQAKFLETAAHEVDVQSILLKHVRGLSSG